MAIYYIAVAGLTSNTGLSSGSPWPISKLTSTGVAGDTIYFNKGDSFNINLTYSRSGSSGNPITFDAYGSGNNPEFNGGGSTSTPALTITGSFITINNIVVKNTGLYCNAPFVINGGHDIRVYNCFGGFGMRGMNILNTTGNIVIDTCWFSNFQSPDSTNTIVGNGGGSGIQWNNCSGSGNKTINSKFYTVIGSGANPTPGVGDIISHYKCFFGTGDVFAGVGSFGYEATNNKVRGGGSSAPGYAGTVGGDVGGSNQYIHNNWFINSGKVGAQVQGGTNINLSNNIVANDSFTWINTSGPNPSVGIAFGNYSGAAVSNITIGGNKICFHTGTGSISNLWWDPASKPFPAFQPTNWTTNTAGGTCDSGASTSSIPNPLFNYGDWNTSSSLVFGSLPTKTYGNADFSPGATSSHSITYTSSNLSVATIIAGNIHIVGVGTSTITANDGTTSINQTLTVNKATLTITADNKTKVYGSTNPTLTISYSGFVNSETSSNLTTLPTTTTSATQYSNSTTYSIVPSGAVSSNYSFTYVNGTLSITQAALTITANNQTKVYAASNPTLTVSYTGFLGTDSSSSLTTLPTITTSATISSSVGSYLIIPSGALATNYVISYINGTLSITKASLTVTANNLSKVQGAVNPTLTETYSGFINGDTTSSITQPTLSTTATTGSAIGTYPITPSGGVATNYTFTYIAGTLTITTTPLVFNSIATQTYGTIDFDPGATGAGGITYTSSNSSVATIVSSKIHITGVGTSTITATDGVSSIPQTLTVNQATLVITADNHAIVVGSSIPTLTVSYSGFVYGQTSSILSVQPTITTTAIFGSPIGTYPITVSGASATNYSITYVGGTLTIIPSGQIIFHTPVVLL